MRGNVRSVTRLYALLSYTALEAPPLRWHAPIKEDDTMFATHLATPLQQSLASHVFGRFIARTPPGSPAGQDASRSARSASRVQAMLPDGDVNAVVWTAPAGAG